MPTQTSKNEQQLANQTYGEMSRVAESRLTYLNEMLQNSEFYLMHDKKQEEAENELRRERDRLAEEARLNELQENNTKREEEMKRRKEATEAFYANQKGLDSIELNLVKAEKKKARKNPDEPADGEDLMALGGDPENEFNPQPDDDDFLDKADNLAGLDDEDDGSFAADLDVTDEKKAKRKSGKRNKADKAERRERKKQKKERRLRKNKERQDTGEVD